MTPRSVSVSRSAFTIFAWFSFATTGCYLLAGTSLSEHDAPDGGTVLRPTDGGIHDGVAVDQDSSTPPTDASSCGLGCMKVRDVAIGSGGICAVLANGEARCWGTPWYESLLAPGTDPFDRIALDETFGLCATRAHDGSIACWGRKYDPAETVEPSLTGVTSFGVGLISGAIAGGQLVRWGSPLPVAVPSGGGWDSFATAGIHVCATRPNMAVWCRYQMTGKPGNLRLLASGSTFDFLPAFCGIDPSTQQARCWKEEGGLANPTESLRQVALAAGIACGIRTSSDSITCWKLEPSPNDIVAAPPTKGPYSKVVVAPSYGCAIRKTGELDCWGSHIPTIKP